MPNTLAGKVAIITGSGQNVGRATALLMAREGAKVVTNTRSPNNPDGTAETTAQAIKSAGGQAVPVYADVTTWEGAKKLIDAALNAFGTIDILVNNAGGSGSGSFIEQTRESWDKSIALNLSAAFYCAHLAVPTLIAKKSGRIIHTSSRVATHRGVGNVPYAASKAGLFGLTYSMARDLEQYGITVNCVMPTSTNTARQARQQAGQTPMGYVVQPQGNAPEQVAPLATYLASEAAAKVTAQVFHAGGGKFTLYDAADVAKQLANQSGQWSVDELAKAFPGAFGSDLGVAGPLFAPLRPAAKP